MVAGEPLRRVGAPTPRLLRSPPLAKVQSHSHHLLRQVLFAYLAVLPILEELVVIAVLHHSLLHCVVYNPCSYEVRNDQRERDFLQSLR